VDILRFQNVLQARLSDSYARVEIFGLQGKNYFSIRVNDYTIVLYIVDI
jgi:hypothetical protein